MHAPHERRPPGPRSPRPAWRASIAAGLLWLTAAGCCVTSVPEPSKYFDRQSPTSALLGFSYSVEIGDWEYAFASLNTPSREAIESPTRLRFGTLLQSDPDFGIPVREVITESIRHRSPPSLVEPGRPDVQRITVFYIDPDSEDGIPKIVTQVYLVREEGEWRVDLLYTLGRQYRDVSEAT